MAEIIAGKYEVMETIGRGGMGTVYKARQRNLDRIVAIKMLSEELASDPEFRARFQQEATVVARLNHPNIVQVHDIEEHNKTFCIIMEFVEGENLQAKIDRDVTLPEKEVAAIGAQVGRALAYAHSRGIIHRDIKPDNIHVTPKGIAKVMDFGIARFLDSKLKTQTGISMGTPKFMSPEQVTGKNVDGQTDLYSLGICLYYCLAGRPPFDGENAISVATRHLYEQPEPPAKLNSSISPAVEKVVLKALEKQKPNRYLTGTEMAEALEAAVGMKTPLRVDSEADERFAGATQKLPAQSYGEVSSTPIPASASGINGEGETAAGYGQMTPLSSRSVPELEDDFRTPRGGNQVNDPTRSFRFSLVVFGGLVIIAVVLLIALVLWLRRSDARMADMDNPAARLISPADRIESVDSEADRLVAGGQVQGARDLWLKFRSQYPDVQSGRVNEELWQIEGRLPVSETEVLAERRYEEAFNHLNKQERALAFAYLKAATQLSPELEKSAITSNTLQNLQRKLAVSPGPADVAAAEAALARAVSLLQNENNFRDAQPLLVQAVEQDYANPIYWSKLGDFFLRTGNIDSARVMYGEAVRRAITADQRTSLNTKLRDISK
jgi:serine/threonine protein kinase/predicted negative regulator of RcsB-dependent stress response